MRTTVIGSYPFPGWLRVRHASTSTSSAPADRAEMQDDAVIAAMHDQVAAGLDVITDGEQTRLDFNLSFYGFLEGIELEARSAAALRPAGPRPARQAPDHRRAGARRAASASSRSSTACAGSRPPGPTLKASVPGPYTLSGRLLPNDRLSRSLGADRGAAADRAAASSTRWSTPAARRSPSTSRR